jgi:LacI family transcriptional regulator
VNRGERQVTVRDVADAARVSVGTVSNVLNHPHRVGPETLQRVLAAIESLGFVPNASASQLRGSPSRAIGLVVLDMTNPFFTEMARGVEEAAREGGLIVILCNSDASPEREDSYLRLLREQRVAGVLITPTRRTPAQKALAEMRSIGAPVVLLDRVAKNRHLCSVAVDDVHGGFLAGEHLVGLGPRTLALVNGPTSIQQCAERRRGFLRATRGAGISDSEVLDCTLSAMNIEAGEVAAGALAASRSFPLSVFCGNDVLAVGFLRGCLAHGLRVPEDVAIVGYDDIVYASTATVSLTSVRQPAFEIGQASMRLMLEELRGVRDQRDHQHASVIFKPELVVRESTSAPKAPPKLRLAEARTLRIIPMSGAVAQEGAQKGDPEQGRRGLD